MNALDTIRFHIDYASDFRLSGWIFDTLTQHQPVGVAIRLPDGNTYEFPSISGRMSRQDVCEQFMLPLDTVVGFDINLRDLLNDCCPDYSLIVNDIEIWSRRESLDKLDSVSGTYSGDLIKEFGRRQVVVCYESKSWFHRLIQCIHLWSPLHLLSAYQGNVSFLFVDINALSDFKEQIIRGSDRSILVLERAVLPKLMHISPTMVANLPAIVLDQHIQFALDFSGMLCVACDRARISNNSRLSPSSLLALLSALSGYSDLFFDLDTALFVHQSGAVHDQMKIYMQEQVQERLACGVLVLSEKPLLRLREVAIDSCAIFVRISELRFLLDALAQKPELFLQIAYRRGRRINTVVVKDQ